VSVARRGTLDVMKYRIVGFIVWQGTRWYVRRRVARLMPSRRVASAILVAGAVSAVAVAAAARADRD
jgi:hypothetical protein